LSVAGQGRPISIEAIALFFDPVFDCEAIHMLTTSTRELRRESTIEAMIGYMKEDGRLGHTHLLVATGHNPRLILN
jgi:hypothetical protein